MMAVPPDLLGARSCVLARPQTGRVSAAALVASTIALAHSLDLRMVAEGVENGAAFTELKRLGCDQAQGYYTSRGVPAAELEHWLGGWKALDERGGSHQERSLSALG